jgi:hypothetical protein
LNSLYRRASGCTMSGNCGGGGGAGLMSSVQISVADHIVTASLLIAGKCEPLIALRFVHMPFRMGG